jgi:hypothetical protein
MRRVTTSSRRALVAVRTLVASAAILAAGHLRAQDLCTRLVNQLLRATDTGANVPTVDRALSTIAEMQRRFPESSLEAVDAVLKHADDANRVSAIDQMLARLNADQANTLFTGGAELSQDAQRALCRISRADPFITEPGRSIHDLLSVNFFSLEEKEEMVRQLVDLLDDSSVVGSHRMVHKAGNAAVGVNRGGQVELRLNDRIRSRRYADLGTLEEVDFDLSGAGSDVFRMPDGTQAFKVDTRTSTHAISAKSKANPLATLALDRDIPDADMTRLIVEAYFMNRRPLLVANVALDATSAQRLATASDAIYTNARSAIRSLGGDPDGIPDELLTIVFRTISGLE